MSSKKYILMVFEGEKTEPVIVDNLKRFFLRDNTLVYALYGNVIYDIYEYVKDDSEGFLDLLPILKEFARNRDKLSGISRDDVSEIYLFFDHDGHSHIANDKRIENMLNHFNDETEHGKLYISYPMVEAIKHLGRSIDFRYLTAKISENTNYKRRVDEDADDEFKHMKRYTINTWMKVISSHVKKLNYIVNGDYSLFEGNITQYETWRSQNTKYIEPNKEVAVLSAFPIFLFDYYGYEYIIKQIDEQ